MPQTDLAPVSVGGRRVPPDGSQPPETRQASKPAAMATARTFGSTNARWSVGRTGVVPATVRGVRSPRYYQVAYQLAIKTAYVRSAAARRSSTSRERDPGEQVRRPSGCSSTGAVAAGFPTALVPLLTGHDDHRDRVSWLDIDDTMRETHGYFKQGVGYGVWSPRS